jgi:methyl-accepting chemotaxis protein
VAIRVNLSKGRGTKPQGLRCFGTKMAGLPPQGFLWLRQPLTREENRKGVFLLPGKEKPLEAAEGKSSPGQAKEEKKVKKKPTRGKGIGWWNSQKLSRKIAIFFLLVILPVFFLVAHTYQRIYTVIDLYEGIVNTNYPYIVAIKEIENAVTRQEAAMGQFLLLGTEESLIALQLRQHDVQVSIEAAREYTKDAEQLKILDSIQSLQADLNSASNNIVAQYQEGNQEQALALYREGTYKSIQDGLRSHCGLLNGLNQEAIIRIQANVRDGASKSIQFLLGAGVFVLILALAAILILPRSITRPLEELTRVSKKIADGDLSVVPEVRSRDEVGTLAAAFARMVEGLRDLVQQIYDSAAKISKYAQDFSTSAAETSKATEQIAATIQDVAQGAEHQVERVNDISRVINDLAAAAQQIAANANTVAGDAAAAQQLAQTGTETAERTADQIEVANSSIQDATGVIKDLGKRSEEIGNIVGLITAIAEQTNLLALNAALEAARAGEQGRGFAVVADEVRKLAEQSADAAKQIGGLIRETQEDIDRAISVMGTGAAELARGTDQVQALEKSFQDILADVQRVAERMQEVSAATEEIASDTERVVTTIEEISEISKGSAVGTQNVGALTEEQTASMEEIAAAAQQLNQMAGDLERLLGRFKL